jgi:hypothetical protein
MAGRQLADSLDECPVSANVPEGKIFNDGGGIESRPYRWMGKECAKLTRGYEEAVGEGVVERLDTELIARREEFPRLVVPEDKTEHAPE